MSPTQNNRDDLILQRLDQLHDEIQGIRDGLRDDLKEYELKALHDKDVENLQKVDKDQEEHLQRLEDRVLSQGQKLFVNICAGAGLVGGIISILHLMHIIP